MPHQAQGFGQLVLPQTIPADVQRVLAKLPASRRPHNWYKTHIAISLGTADRNAAKAKCPAVAAAVEDQLKALREGPKPLTAKQIAALSGKLYRAFAEGGEADPILSEREWRAIAARQREAHKRPLLGIYADDAERRAAALEQWWGRTADSLLRCHALVTDDESRRRLIERFSIDAPHASEKLARNAEGDYSPDGYVQRFPTWVASPDTREGRPMTSTAGGKADMA